MQTAIALKEWDTVIQALAHGDQMMLLRKGGIRDPKGAFVLEHDAFLLYPTFEHQKAEHLQSAYHAQLSPPCTPDEISFQAYAEVADVKEVTDVQALAGQASLHIWTPAFFEQRQAYRPHAPMLAVLLRVFQLSVPVRYPVLEQDLGCHSWVPLEQPLTLEGMSTALEPAVFEARCQQFLDCLQS